MIEPGCFGVPSIYSFKSKVCGGCKFRDNCQIASQQALLAIKSSSVVTDILSQHIEYSSSKGLNSSQASERVYFTQSIQAHQSVKKARYALTAKQLELLDNTPKKVSAFLNTIWSKGLHIEMLERARAGQNPFDINKNRPYHLACRELIAKTKITRSSLVSVIMDEFDWTYSAAYSQVSLMWQVLPALEITEADNTFMRYLFPDAKRHNT